MSEEKPHKPSEKRLEEARKIGRNPKSQVFTNCCVYVCANICLIFALPAAWVDTKMLLQYQGLASEAQLLSICTTAALIVLKIVGGSFFVVAVVGMSADLFQVGWYFRPYLILPNLNRITNGGGVQKVMNAGASIPRELARVVALCTVLVGFLWWIGAVPLALNFPRSGSYDLLARIGVPLLCIVLACGLWDLRRQRKKFFSEYSLSHDELRREIRDQEGDPYLRSFRRALHEAVSREQLVSRIRRSRVIIVERSGSEE